LSQGVGEEFRAPDAFDRQRSVGIVLEARVALINSIGVSKNIEFHWRLCFR